MSIDEPTPSSTRNRIKKWLKENATHHSVSAQPITENNQIQGANAPTTLNRGMAPPIDQPVSHGRPMVAAHSGSLVQQPGFQQNSVFPAGSSSYAAPAPSMPVYSNPHSAPAAPGPVTQPLPHHHHHHHSRNHPLPPASLLSQSHSSKRDRYRSLDLPRSSQFPSTSVSAYNTVHSSSPVVVHPSAEQPIVVSIGSRDDCVVVPAVGQNVTVIDINEQDKRNHRRKKEKKRSSLRAWFDHL